MTYTAAPLTTTSALITPQFLHLAAVEQHEKAIKHHRQAAKLHDAGDSRQADTHRHIANTHAIQAAATSARSLNVTLW
jgi:hypothetical protein